MSDDDEKIRVLIADAQLLMADSLAAGLCWQPDFEILNFRPTSGKEVVETAEGCRPDVVLVDYWMPDMEGPAATRMLVAGNPPPRVLVLSWFYGPRQVWEALDAGACGFLPKSLPLEKVVSAIEQAYAGVCPVFASQTEEMVGRISRGNEKAAEVWTKLLTLSHREVDILRLLNDGLHVGEIAQALKISQSTVRTHLNHIFEIDSPKKTSNCTERGMPGK